MIAPAHRIDSPPRGIGLMVVGSGCITLNDAAMKWVVSEHPVGQAVFVRGLFAFVVIAVLAYRAGGPGALRIHSVRGQALCAVTLVVPLFLFVYSLSQLSLAFATLVFFTNPLFVTVLAPLIIGERVGWRRYAAVAVGFVGALVVIRPTGSSFTWIMLLPVLSSLCAAFRDLTVRRLVASETTLSLFAYSSLAVTLAALGTAPFGWPPLSWGEIGLLALASVGFGLGIYFTTDALRYADASLLSPYKYSAIVWALLLGFLLWGDVPGPAVWAGAVLIVASGLYILHRERVRYSP